MARVIESPGVQITEIDLSQNATLPVGTNVLVNGFAAQGPTMELVNVTSKSELEQASHQFAQRIYQDASKQHEAPGGADNASAGDKSSGPSGGKDKVYDADYEVVDDDK